MLNTSGWAFSISSNSTHGIGLAPHLLGELAALVIAHIAGRRPDQPGDGVLFHVFRHIQPDHGVFVTEHGLGQGFAQLGLAHAGGPQENEGADGTLGILEPHPAPADGLGHRRNRLVLARRPAGAGSPPCRSSRWLSCLGELGHGHACPAGHDLRDSSAAVTSPVMPAFFSCQCLLAALPASGVSSFSSSRRWAARSKSWSLTAAFFSSASRLTSSSSFFRSGGAVKRCQPHPGGRLVNQVDGLVRQIPVGDIAGGQRLPPPRWPRR